MISRAPRPVDLASTTNWDEAKIIAGPADLSEREKWRQELKEWRYASAKRFNYSDAAYKNEKFINDSTYNLALIWLWDEFLFEFEQQKFTPEKLIEDSKKFGGFDGIILWHAYPVIGIDSRNQFDFYNDVPGLEELIDAFHKAKVKVYLNYNPWDKWTARPDSPDEIEIAQLIARFNFDGVFLDTLKSAEPAFMAPIRKVRSDLVIAGESTVQQERICDHTMSWAQWFADSEIPGVLRAKYFEPRHMLHQTRRWSRSHIQELQIAWLNGAGMLIWEVVFGSWVGWNKRDVCMWREMVAILRQYTQLIIDGVWEPLTALSPEAESAQLYASSFSLGDVQLITIINKSDHDYEGLLARGLSGNIPAWGVGAISINSGQAVLHNFTYHYENSYFPNRENIREAKLEGSIETLTYTYRNREAGLYSGPAFIDAWKPLPPHLHQKLSNNISIPVLHGELDEREVNNQEYFEFVRATEYRPSVTNRFLAHWIDGAPSLNQLLSPVTYIDLADATAFAHWKGVRIPNEWEWQFNAHNLKSTASSHWNLTNSIHSDGRTRFLILKGGSSYNLRNGQGSHSASGLAESDWYCEGGVVDNTWVEKYLLLGLGLSRSENISFRCFKASGGI